MVHPEIYSHQLEIFQNERLSDNELGGYLSAIGNNESKALLLVLMAQKPDSVYQKSDLRQLVRNAQEMPNGEIGIPTWDITKKNLWGYCSPAFEEVGLVARQMRDQQDNNYGYSVTRIGIEKGAVLAGLLLNYSLHHERSLYSIFGSAQSNSGETVITTQDGEQMAVKNRAPIRRYRILRELYSTEDPMRWVDLASRLGDPKYAEDLSHFSRIGLITYDLAKRGEEFAEYRLPEVVEETASPKSVWEMATLTKQIYKIALESGLNSFRVGDVHNQLVEQYPERANMVDLKGKIASILKGLAEQGLLISQGFNKENQSRILLTDEQRDEIGDLIEVVEGFQAQDPEVRRQGNEYARRISSDSQSVRTLLFKAKNASPYANPPDSDNVMSLIYEIINNSDRPLSKREILDQLEEKGLSMGVVTVGKYLTKLGKAGGIIIDDSKRKIHHYTKASQDVA